LALRLLRRIVAARLDGVESALDGRIVGMANTQRVAVVTGASSGIGEACARSLAEAGFHVCCAARRLDRIQTLADEIGGVAVACDVTRPDDVRALAASVGDAVHVLVNNAGAAFGADEVADADPADWQAMYDVNVLGTLQVTQALLPALLASGDAVLINMGSTAGHTATKVVAVTRQRSTVSR
jgi:NADP-dependent 3-hydroxy acid dehydrogenase YdfG